ncbi:hypothetical protein [[Mycoplasma] collis]|uniref:hypothetical protein n=1 Tax=[Mycoplasma] collis TaxID=2127 RepID=UPI000A43D312|nr:hypothetical protein [[Mycoplasma] collis]
MNNEIITKILNEEIKANDLINLNYQNDKNEIDFNYVEIYFNIVKKIIKQYQQEINNYQVLEYKKLKISNYFINKREEKFYNNYLYQRHHIEEIFISGAFLQSNKLDYNNGLCLIVNIEEHAFLHYLIVKSRTTNPNYGMLIQLKLKDWSNIAKKYCKKYNIKYDRKWKKMLYPKGITNSFLEWFFGLKKYSNLK